MPFKDRTILRQLAAKYLEICNNDMQNERRDLWRQHNSLKRTRPLIYVRSFAWNEMPDSQCLCTDPFYRQYENFFRQMIFHDSFNDDVIFEPWVTVKAVCVTPKQGLWGLPTGWINSDEPRGAKQINPPIKNPEDARRMIEPHHVIDEEETSRNSARLHEAIGGMITITIDRAPIYSLWNADISTQLGHLRGIEQIMWDMTDRPAWLHEILAFMRDGILQTHEEAEKRGDWSLCNHENQAMPYAEELEDPAPNSHSVTRDKLWLFCASQELTLVSPEMFNEFMVQYQIPIMEKFGLSAYGCCEDLTMKIDVLKPISNLRRIAVAPVANVAKCAEQIGTKYVLSYRPSPSDMVGYGFDPERVRGILRHDLEACRENHVDVTLKDVETVQFDPDRVRRWVEITRSVIEELF